jgi:general secretion pathway protein A
MYLEFYKLKELPFRLAPEPRFLYWSAGHAAALACMRSAQARHNGCAIITGDKGTGKTTLLEHLLQREPPARTVRIDFPPRTLTELSEILQSRNEPDATSGPAVIVCDNAHLFSAQMLAEILLKTMLPTAQAHATSLVLAGEPALAHALEHATSASRGDLVDERAHLPPLTAAEVIAYVAHRLEMAGAAGRRIFRDDICIDIYRETKGNPRLVNALCDAAMVVACERELPEVGLAELRRGLEDLGRLTAAQRVDAEPAVAPAPSIDPPVDTRRPVLARLRLLHHGELILERELARGRLRIGRGSDNEMRIDGKYISRYHCRILTSDDMCIVEDVQSTNGLSVNEQRTREHRLGDGDVIQMGEHELHYVDLRRAPSPPN